MANNCAFDMRITGGKAEIYELLDMLHWRSKGVNPGLGRIFSIELDSLEKTSNPEIYTVYLSGDCANSVKSSMRDDGIRFPSLESETKRLGLVAEIYSSETGNEFQEHVLICKGEVLVDACVHYEEHFVEEYDSIEEYNAAHGTTFTRDMINCNGEICIGGFGDDYGIFEDVSQYFGPEYNKTSLSVDEQIRAASDLRRESMDTGNRDISDREER